MNRPVDDERFGSPSTSAVFWKTPDGRWHSHAFASHDLPTDNVNAAMSGTSVSATITASCCTSSAYVYAADAPGGRWQAATRIGTFESSVETFPYAVAMVALAAGQHVVSWYAAVSRGEETISTLTTRVGGADVTERWDDSSVSLGGFVALAARGTRVIAVRQAADPEDGYVFHTRARVR